MKKLIEGIVEFRRTTQESYRKSFGKLATGQSPDTLFIACSDSRVVPNTFASTNPGDLFVLRNVGNMIPPCDEQGVYVSDESEAAAIEYAVQTLGVRNIIVCGHSECGAMRAIQGDRRTLEMPNLRSWLRHGEPALSHLNAGMSLDTGLAPHNQLSQLNVLLQMEHVKSYPTVRRQVEAGLLAVHGLWFDIGNADVYAYEDTFNRFLLIDEEEAARLLERLGAATPSPVQSGT